METPAHTPEPAAVDAAEVIPPSVNIFALPSRRPSRAPEMTALVLHGVYRLSVAAGAFGLAWSLGTAWALLAALPLLFLSPKTKN